MAWGRVRYQLFEAGDLVLPVAAAYFRKAGDQTAVRTITFGDVADARGACAAADDDVKVAAKPGESTALTYKTLKFDVAIPDEKFTEQALRR